jgi:glycine/D-amino acid oxidase-like deaminating enzyme
VEPYELCTKLMAAAEKAGAKFIKGCVEGVATAPGDSGLTEVCAVVVDGARIECDGVVVTMGPWSALVSPTVLLLLTIIIMHTSGSTHDTVLLAFTSRIHTCTHKLAIPIVYTTLLHTKCHVFQLACKAWVSR